MFSCEFYLTSNINNESNDFVCLHYYCHFSHLHVQCSFMADSLVLVFEMKCYQVFFQLFLQAIDVPHSGASITGLSHLASIKLEQCLCVCSAKLSPPKQKHTVHI